MKVSMEVDAADLTIAEVLSRAGDFGLIDGGGWYLDTLGPILQHYPQITLADYWALRVSDHVALCGWLVRSGILEEQDG